VRYSNPACAIKVLEIFSSTFFGLYEPSSDLLKALEPFFTNPHYGPRLLNLHGVPPVPLPCRLGSSGRASALNGHARLLLRIVVTLVFKARG
jgi:hypothetical protein